MVLEDERVSVEVRCPQGPRNLLMKLSQTPGVSVVRTPDNLMELYCRDCTRQARREMDSAGLSRSFRILHLFDFAGEFVSSVREPLPKD